MYPVNIGRGFWCLLVQDKSLHERFTYSKMKNKKKNTFLWFQSASFVLVIVTLLIVAMVFFMDSVGSVSKGAGNANNSHASMHLGNNRISSFVIK